MDKNPVPGVAFPAAEEDMLGHLDAQGRRILRLLVTMPATLTVGDVRRASPVAGVQAEMLMTFSPDYPFKPPTLSFPGKPRVPHPHIDEEIGVFASFDELDSAWRPTHNMGHVLRLLMQRLEAPALDPLHAVRGDLARMLRDGRFDEYDAHVRALMGPARGQ